MRSTAPSSYLHATGIISSLAFFNDFVCAHGFLREHSSLKAMFEISSPAVPPVVYSYNLSEGVLDLQHKPATPTPKVCRPSPLEVRIALIRTGVDSGDGCLLRL